jgi:hypothetical protein
LAITENERLFRFNHEPDLISSTTRFRISEI